MSYVKYTKHNRKSLCSHKLCVCIDCLKEYYPKDIREWCDNGTTAICPYCCDDTVLVSPKCTNLYTRNNVINYLKHHRIG